MSKKKDLDAFLEEEGNAIEADADAPITDATKVTRGHPKTRTLQVRLSPEEYEGLEKIADERGLPVSTVAREQLQKLLRATQRSPEASEVVSALEKFITNVDQRVGVDWAHQTSVDQALLWGEETGLSLGEVKAGKTGALAYLPILQADRDRVLVLLSRHAQPTELAPDQESEEHTDIRQ